MNFRVRFLLVFLLMSFVCGTAFPQTSTGSAPSGTENIYKIYAESFEDPAHLDAIISEAQQIVNNALR
jgi:hypothetical protein